MLWIIGNKGMLGTELVLRCETLGIPFVGTDRDVSILDTDALRTFAQGKGISWIVNCAAYTTVDKAEEEEKLCHALNAEGPEHLGHVAKELGARLLHISTDYVFSGTPILENGRPRPYQEADPPDPTGVYGRTKAEGERRLREACPESIILRTAWLYGKHGPNFVYTMLRLMKERDRIGVVADQRGSPTWAYDLAAAILRLVALPPDKLPPGIYHYTNEGETTWYDFAREIHRLGRQYGLLDRDCAINPLTTDQYLTKAKRPAYSVLSKDKIKALGVAVPPWNLSLEQFMTNLKGTSYASL